MPSPGDFWTPGGALRTGNREKRSVKSEKMWYPLRG